MTTQTSPRSPAQGERIQAELVVLTPGEHPRRQTDERALDELAASIRAQGVLEPILVRRKGQKLEVLVGNRRTAAAKRAGLDTIPAIVVECSDEEAREIALAENLHHVGLDPVDEVRFIGEMLRGGRSAEEVAARIGKSAGYVARREACKHLSKAWLKALDQRGTKLEPKKGQADWQVQREQDRLDALAQVTAAQLEWIALLPVEQQDRILDAAHHDSVPSARALRAEVAASTQELASAPWPLDDDALVPMAGACTACPNNSANQGKLFEGLEDAPNGQGRCLDKGCWAKKLAAHVERKAAAAREQHGKDLVLVQTKRRGPYDEQLHEAEREAIGKAFGKNARPLEAHQYSESSAKKPGKGLVPALVVDGPEAGEVLYVRPQVHQNGTSSAKPKPAAEKKPADKKKDALARLESRRMGWAIDYGAQLVRMFDPRLITEAQYAKLPADPTEHEERLEELLTQPGAFAKLEPERVSKVLAISARLVAACGSDHAGPLDRWFDAKGKPSDGDEQPLRLALADNDREIARRLWLRVRRALLGRFKRFGACDPKTEHHRDQRADADAVAELLMGAPAGWLAEQAAAAVPPPKWLDQSKNGETKAAKGEPNPAAGETEDGSGETDAPAPPSMPRKRGARAQAPAAEPVAAESKPKKKPRTARK